jgi:hypothetical protein
MELGCSNTYCRKEIISSYRSESSSASKTSAEKSRFKSMFALLALEKIVIKDLLI